MARTMASPVVEYGYLGRSGVRVSNICLGTATFAGKASWLSEGNIRFPTQTTEDLAHQLLDRFAECGGNFIDTADMYGYGQAERVLGNWLAKNDRQKYIVATKVRVQMDANDVNCVGLSRRHIVRSIEGSLERLGTHYVDLYQSHMWYQGTPLDETLRTFDDLIRCGKVRYFGASNVCGWQMQKIVDRIDVMGLNKCVTLQQQYSLLERQSEVEEFMVCQNEGIGVLPWSPLKCGLLTGKFQRDVQPSAKDSRVGYYHHDDLKNSKTDTFWTKRRDSDTYWNLLDTLKSVGDKHGKSIPQVALRWLLQRDVVVSVIIGVTSMKQLEENMGAATGWELTEEEMAQLSSASPRHNPYPYEMIWRANRDNKFNQPFTCI